jgi:hypothetical protein
MINNKILPIEPKIISTENSYQEKTMIFVKNITKRHFEIYPLTKTEGISVILGQDFGV